MHPRCREFLNKSRRLNGEKDPSSSASALNPGTYEQRVPQQVPQPIPPEATTKSQSHVETLRTVLGATPEKTNPEEQLPPPLPGFTFGRDTVASTMEAPWQKGLCGV